MASGHPFYSNTGSEYTSHTEKTLPDSSLVQELCRYLGNQGVESRGDISSEKTPDDMPDYSGSYGPFAVFSYPKKTQEDDENNEYYDERVVIGPDEVRMTSYTYNKSNESDEEAEPDQARIIRSRGRSQLTPGIIITTHGPVAFPSQHVKELWTEGDPDLLVDFDSDDFPSDSDKFNKDINYEAATLYLDLRQWAPGIDENDNLYNKILDQDIDKYYKWAPCVRDPGPWSQQDNILLAGEPGNIDKLAPSEDVIILAHVIATKTYTIEDSESDDGRTFPRQIVAIFGNHTDLRIDATRGRTASSVLAKITGGPDDGGLYDVDFYEAGKDGPKTGEGKIEMLNSNLSEKIPAGTMVFAHKIVSSITNSEWESEEEDSD